VTTLITAAEETTDREVALISGVLYRMTICGVGNHGNSFLGFNSVIETGIPDCFFVMKKLIAV